MIEHSSNYDLSAHLAGNGSFKTTLTMAAIASFARFSAKRFAARTSNARFLVSIKFTPSHEYIKVRMNKSRMIMLWNCNVTVHFLCCIIRLMVMLARSELPPTLLERLVTLCSWTYPLLGRS
jgi:hypothetical protein